MSLPSRSWSLLLVAVLSLAACGGKQPASAPCKTEGANSGERVQLATDEYATELVVKACACETYECKRQVAIETDKLVLPFAKAMMLMQALARCRPETDAAQPEDAITEIGTLRDDACACADARCAAGVQERFQEFMERMKYTKGSSEDAERAQEIAMEMVSCLRKAQGE